MRLPLLALLARGPAHGYELKQDLELLLGSAYPQPNVGQIYVTLGRLEKDGLVTHTPASGGDRRDQAQHQAQCQYGVNLARLHQHRRPPAEEWANQRWSQR